MDDAGGGEGERQAQASSSDQEVAEGGRSLDDWGGLDQFRARGSRGVLRHMTEDEEAAGLSWENFRQH